LGSSDFILFIFIFIFFVWENLTSVSERYIFAKLKGLSLWKVGWGGAMAGPGRVGSGQVGSDPILFFEIFFFEFFWTPEGKVL
jgi:hypothetical protein